jgi:hypothetical protein
VDKSLKFRQIYLEHMKKVKEISQSKIKSRIGFKLANESYTAPSKVKSNVKLKLKENKTEVQRNKKKLSRQNKQNSINKQISDSQSETDEYNEQYIEEFKTSPPVGWKRPASRATLFVKALIDDDQIEEENSKEKDSNKVISKLLNRQEKKRIDKEFYFEAIYREDFSGRIFMKYLLSKNKMVYSNALFLAIKKI